jgi:dienelactone hydrolase
MDDSGNSCSRRKFLERAGLGALALEMAPLLRWGNSSDAIALSDNDVDMPVQSVTPNMIGSYGPWAASMLGEQLSEYSFRRSRWEDLDSWRAAAHQQLMARLALPDTGGRPEVTVHDTYTYEGLQVEELSWQLPYGRPTEAVFLKPPDSSGPLPGVVGLHDHGGVKYFGKRKITRTGDSHHRMMLDHQDHYYDGVAWANELARRGYAVLVHDAFTFASRRVLLQNVSEEIRDGLTDENPEDPENIRAYNDWAADHESIMAKSLFCAGTTWPGVFTAEDQRALDVLAARDDVDADRLGCCGLSGGGLRTVFLGGVDPRIKVAVPVGMMTTWRDYLLDKSFTHTWMIYIPLLPKELDYPEILGLRVPRPILVLNNEEDQLFTLPEMQRADEILQEVYDKAGAADRYTASFYPGPHKFDREMQAEAFEWFDRWL